MSKLARLNQLFDEGTELVLPGPAEAPPELLWISKLNPFEYQECRNDGSAARARLMLLLKDTNSDAWASLEDEIVGSDVGQLRNRLIQQSELDFYRKALQDLEAEEEWREKIQVIRASTEMPPSTDDERESLARMTQEYQDALATRHDAYAEEMLAELKDQSEDALRDAVRTGVHEERGIEAFSQDFQVSEFYYSLRECAATKQYPNGTWDHRECDHSQRALASRAEVRALPPGVFQAVAEAAAKAKVTADEARFSAAPSSSSESSGPASQPEESAPSTPEVMSPVAVGT